MLRGANRWLPGYLRSQLRRPGLVQGPVHLMFGIMDHYEPLNPGGKQPYELGMKRVARWRDQYRSFADQFHDADGRPPRHTFFYPEEEYHQDYLDVLTDLTRDGYGEVEIHLHHSHEDAEKLRRTLSGFRDRLREDHGLLGSFSDGRLAYAFIHGNWALCNSDPNWCGVPEELTILKETGCYVDMTMPSMGKPHQTPIVNSIYYATNKPGQSCSHFTGQHLKVKNPSNSPLKVLPDAGDLLCIQGPLAVNFGNRKWGLIPRIENADVSGSNRPTPQRASVWINQHIHVAGRPDWIFIKLHTHGCVEANADALLGDAMADTHRFLNDLDPDAFQLHYVTAREMANIAKAAEAGASGNPGAYRDFQIQPPPVAG